MSSFTSRFISTAISILMVALAASLHEFGHALAAHLCGDDTAREAGRLTLNPLRHIDLTGSILLPLLLGMCGGPVFAFAKPVPYNPNRLHNPDRDEPIVALAGPLANLVQAVVGSALLGLALQAFAASTSSDILYYLILFLSSYVYVNLILMFFNIIPIPPLDGSKLLMPFLHGEARETYYSIQRYAMPIVFVLVCIVPSIFGVDPVGSYLDLTAGRLYSFLVGLWG